MSAAEFGEWLDEERRERGWKRWTFANIIGVSRTQMDNWLAGRTLPPPVRIPSIARALNFTELDVAMRYYGAPAWLTEEMTRRRGEEENQMAVSNQNKSDGTLDRRRRHHNDPTVPITVNIDVTTLKRTDAYVVATNATRSGVIRTALNEYFDRRDDPVERTRQRAIERAKERAYDRVARGDVGDEREA